jgi:hypothetical protein
MILVDSPPSYADKVLKPNASAGNGLWAEFSQVRIEDGGSTIYKDKLGSGTAGG